MMQATVSPSSWPPLRTSGIASVDLDSIDSILHDAVIAGHKTAAVSLSQTLTGSTNGPTHDIAATDSISESPPSEFLEHTTDSSNETESAVSILAAAAKEATEPQWRLGVVPGRTVVFINAGYEGKRFIFDLARKMQLRVFVVDAADSWSRHLVDEGLADGFIPLNIEHLDDTTFTACVQAIENIQAEQRVDAIVSFCELAQPLVARLAARFGLPGNSLESVTAARDKHLSRERYQAAGLPTPKFFCITEDGLCEAAADHVGFPAVLKPVSGAASIGVVRVNNLQALRDGVRRVHSQLLAARVVSGALQEGEVSPTGGAGAAGWIDLALLLEEYLDGQEVDVDIVMANGRSCYEAVTDNAPTMEPYFNETISNCPSVLPQHHQAELRHLAVASCKALGLHHGVFHVEAKYTSRGPRIIEVNCRMGGGSVHLTNRLVYGVDLAVEQLILSCGGPCMDRMEDLEPLCNIAEYTINCPRSGYIEHADFLAKWQGHPRVVYAVPLVHPGQRVIGPEEGMPTWLCDVMCTASTLEKAIQFVKDIEEQTVFPIRGALL